MPVKNQRAHRKNLKRARSAQGAVDGYCQARDPSGNSEYAFEPGDVILVDLLTDLRHWARREGVDVDDCLRVSADHFSAEVSEEGGDK